MPKRPHQSRLAIPPPSEGAPTNLHTLRFKRCHHLRPQGPKLRCRLTRPWHAEDPMQSPFPVTFYFVWTPRLVSVHSLCELILYPRPCFARICRETRASCDTFKGGSANRIVAVYPE